MENRTIDNPFIEMRDIHKTFGNIYAVRGVNLSIYRGEILGLLGENGAGKTTLMNILSGLYKPDRGDIYIDGKKANIRSPKDAIEKGIIMVHQHFKLVKNYTALENILLGTPYVRGIRSNWTKKARKIIEELMSKYKVYIDLDAKVEGLSIGDQQKVEILKALIRGARLLIMDEPTTNLSPYDVRSLKEILLNLRNTGVSVIVISHKLRDVIDISNRIAVMRKGELVRIFEHGTFDEHEILNAMFGREKERLESVIDMSIYYNINTSGIEIRPVLKLEEISTEPYDSSISLRDVSLELYRGEILGIAGVAGNGQKELAEVIVGIKRPVKGRIIFEESDVTAMNTATRYSMGLFYIPEDRLGDGVLHPMSIAENIILGKHREIASMGIFINYKEINKIAAKYIDYFDIKAPNPYIAVGKLSGGNIQKVLIARALALKPPKVLIAHNPTRGLDVATMNKIHKVFLDLKSRGSSILLISDDLDEILRLSDRISVMYKGRLSRPISRSEVTYDYIAKLMVGIGW